MSFYLSKILDFLTSPIVWIFLLLIWTLIQKKNVKKAVVITTIIFYIFSNEFIVDLFLRSYECKNTPIHTINRKLEAVIVLGGFTNIDKPSGQTLFYSSVDRMLYGLWIYKQKKAKYIILSGGNPKLYDDVNESDLIKNYLVSVGIPDSVIIIENQSRNTYENAKYIGRLTDSLSLTPPYYLVTSGYHMPRSLKVFRHWKIPVIPVCVDQQAGPLKFYPDYLFLPSIGAWRKWDTLLHEWIGLLWYKILGYY